MTEFTAKLAKIRKGLKEKATPEKLERFGRKGIEQNAMPASGKFVFDLDKHYVNDENNPTMAHLRIGFEGSDETVSLSRLQIQAPRIDQPVRFRKWSKDGNEGWMLQGNPVNPGLSKYAQDELAAYLDGKTFSAEEVSVNVLPYVEGGYTDQPSEADVVMKSAYKVALK